MIEDLLIRLRLVGDEAQALRALSALEMRRPHEQVRYLIRSELERLGWLKPSEKPEPRHQQTEVKQ